jgi:hypothetical protein
LLTTKRKKFTKNGLKKINHIEHKQLKEREARNIKRSSLYPFDFTWTRPRGLIIRNGTAIAVPLFVAFVLFVVESLRFGCDCAALDSRLAFTRAWRGETSTIFAPILPAEKRIDG